MDDFKRQILEMRDRLNAVSPSFCLAKWTWLTLHLPKGSGHSCHLPNVQKIPLEELEKSPHALHNPEYKKRFRKEMQEGTRPAECGYCWYNEDNSPDTFSERWLNSAAFYSAPFFEEVKAQPWDANVYPKFLEVIFSTKCQLACSYCNSEYSSRWADEEKKLGAFPEDARGNAASLIRDEGNPYVKAFWDWWPEASKRLTVFRISGGEPLLSPDTFRILDELAAGDAKPFELMINSNMSVPELQWGRFREKIAAIVRDKKVRKFTLWGSIDAAGKQAEYIRHGLDYDLLCKRAEEILELTKGTDSGVSFTVTHNNLSLSSFNRLLDFFHALRQQHGRERVGVYVHRVKGHEHQYLDILPRSFAAYLEDSVAYMRKLDFAEWEIDLLYRLLARFQAPAVDMQAAKRKFYRFFAEHDRRRGTNFLATFPEYADFYAECRALAESPVKEAITHA